MCGILFCATQSKETSKEQFGNLLQLLHHRGPDNQSTWSHSTQTENVYVGHTRLAIVGVEDGTQPIVSTCGNYVLSVNGEIYNYETLWSELCKKGYTRNLKTDCEVILPLYQEYGSECVKHLDGIFSFVLYDKQKNSILIARDRIGVLPCYVGFNSS
jgi:asparagine synthase (glutamine-hydrolysing)